MTETIDPAQESIIAPIAATRRKPDGLSPSLAPILGVSLGVAALGATLLMVGWFWTQDAEWRACLARSDEPATRISICNAVIADQKQHGVYLAAAYHARAAAWADQDGVVEALSDYDRAIALAPTNPAHWHGRCRLRAGNAIDLDLALEDCDKALALRPGFVAARDAKALALLKLERFPEAVAAFSAGANAGPGAAWRRYGRGLAKLRLGDAAGGRADIDRALAMQPEVAAAFERQGETP